MTQAEKLLEIHKDNPLEAIKAAMAIGYEAAVKMSAISKDTLIKQWFEDEVDYNL